MRHVVMTCLLAATMALVTGARAAGTGPSVNGAWARAPVGAAGAMALYMTVHGGPAPDRLVAVSSDIAGMAMMHESIEHGDVASMRMLDGIDIPAGGTVTLRPGGMHVMLEDLARRPAAGQTITVLVRFRSGASDSVLVMVRPPGAGSSTSRARASYWTSSSASSAPSWAASSSTHSALPG